MQSFTLATILFAAAALAVPALNSTGTAPVTEANNSGKQTLQINDIAWKNDRDEVVGLGFTAKVQDSTPEKIFKCTTDVLKSLLKGDLAFGRIIQCATDSPLTFAYDNSTANNFKVWYTTDLKSYTGEHAVTPGDKTPFKLELAEVEPAPTETIAVEEIADANDDATEVSNEPAPPPAGLSLKDSEDMKKAVPSEEVAE